MCYYYKTHQTFGAWALLKLELCGTTITFDRHEGLGQFWI